MLTYHKNERVILPDYSTVTYLAQVLPEKNFDAILLSEGTQGISLVSFFPQKDLKIVGYDSL